MEKRIFYRICVKKKITLFTVPISIDLAMNTIHRIEG